MFDFLHMAQREDKALRVPLTLSDEEHAASRQGNITRGHMAATLTQVSLVPGAAALPSPAPYPSTRPCCPMSRWLSSREMRPWNQGWVRWMAGGREGRGAVTPGRGPSF